ncbi:12118_t:CDS:2, partial [Gigaspora margarita]
RIYHSVKSAQEQTPENSPHNAEGIQEQTPENSSQCPRTNAEEFTTQCRVFKNKHQRIHHSTESAKDKRRRIYHTMLKVFKNKHQRLHHSAQGQTPENLLYNAEGVQEQTSENSLQSPHNTEDVQEHQRIHYSAESAKGQMPENSPPNAE